jgi:hypothetical protein
MIVPTQANAFPSELSDWFASHIGEEIVKVENAAGMAGQNRVWKVTTPSRLELVIRCGSPERHLFSLSGIEIRRHLLDAKIAVPLSLVVSENGEIPGFGICEIMTVVDGEDLEIAWPSLSKTQFLDLAINAADAVKASIDQMTHHRELPINGFGFCRWGAFQPVSSWWAWCENWLNWVANLGARNGTVTNEQVDRLRAGLTASRHLIEQVTLEQAKTFVWDVAERNVMVQSGRWSGLVDQDVVMVGDPMIAPALARIALEQAGCSWVQEHERAWMSRWNASADDEKRSSIYKALFAMQFAAKAGQELPDGRKKPAAREGLVDNAISEMERIVRG